MAAPPTHPGLLRELRQEEDKENSLGYKECILGYKVRPCLKETKQNMQTHSKEGVSQEYGPGPQC